MIFSGSSCLELANKTAKHLNTTIGQLKLGRFSDGEIMVEILENIRNRHVFIIQSTCYPANDHLMELLCIVDAARRASASKITAIVPYFGYARQDRRPHSHSRRVPISAAMVADLFETVGIEHVLTFDLHAEQIQGFFHIPVDNIYTTSFACQHLHSKINPAQDITIVSPDVGGIARARAMVKHLPHSQLAVIDKRRLKPNQSEIMHIIGDVKDRQCIIVDDIVDTGGTLCQAADKLIECGASSVLSYITHPVLSKDCATRIRQSALESIWVTNTIPVSPSTVESSGSKIQLLDLSFLLAESIRCILSGNSLSAV